MKHTVLCELLEGGGGFTRMIEYVVSTHSKVLSLYYYI